MSLFRPHEPVCVDSPKKTAHFLEVSWRFLLKDGGNAFLPWLDTNWHQPISKPISFLDGPLTFEGLMVKTFALRQDNTLSIVRKCSFQVLERYQYNQGRQTYCLDHEGLVP